MMRSRFFNFPPTVLLLLALVTGCGDDEPRVVASPGDYAPYEASQEEIQKQQEEAMERIGR